MADILEILITFFLGVFGIHRMIKGHWLSGIVWLLTGGLFTIGWIIDVIWVIMGKPLFWPK
ncbi:MAG: NINE protein [Candidatus Heimdallarchaeota archaeon]